MKKFLMLAAVFGVTVYAANKLMAQKSGKSSEVQNEMKDDQKEIQGRFDKLGKQVKDKLAKAEDDLKNADDKAYAGAQKAVDALKKQAKEIEEAAKKAGQEAKDDWDTVKEELSDMASKFEKDFKK